MHDLSDSPISAWVRPQDLAKRAGVEPYEIHRAAQRGEFKLLCIVSRAGRREVSPEQYRDNLQQRSPAAAFIGREAADTWIAARDAKQEAEAKAKADRDLVTPTVYDLAREIVGPEFRADGRYSVSSSREHQMEVARALFERIANGDINATCDAKTEGNYWQIGEAFRRELAWEFVAGADRVVNVLLAPCGSHCSVWASSLRVSRVAAAGLGFKAAEVAETSGAGQEETRAGRPDAYPPELLRELEGALKSKLLDGKQYDSPRALMTAWCEKYPATPEIKRSAKGWKDALRRLSDKKNQ